MFGIYGMAEAVSLYYLRKKVIQQTMVIAKRPINLAILLVKTGPICCTDSCKIWLETACHVTCSIRHKVLILVLHRRTRILLWNRARSCYSFNDRCPHHQFYTSGISDILTVDETIKQNPDALMQLCLGAFSLRIT